VLEGDLQRYAGLLIPGGHAPLIDLANNPEVGALLRHFHQAGKPTAAICHGPIALLSAQRDPAAYQAPWPMAKHRQRPTGSTRATA